MKNRNIIDIISLLLVLFLVIGCIGSDKKNVTELTEVELTEVPSTTTEEIIEPVIEETVGSEEAIEKITEDTVASTTIIVEEQGRIDKNGFLAYTFKVNDEKMMLDRNIQLLDLATEEGIAIIKVDGDQYRLTYNIEQEIKGRIIKIIDLDGIYQTVKIMVKYNTKANK